MATLEKIRKRSVLLIVVIAVALLAFILGDAITNSRNLFGTGTTVAKIGSERIDITEFQQKREQLNQQYEEARKNNPQQVAGLDVQMLPQMALDQLVQERLLSNAVSAMKIKTSPELLRFYMLEAGQMSPELQTLVANLQSLGVNVQSAQQAYDVIFSPQKYNLTAQQVEAFQQQWLQVENKYKDQIAQNVYMSLLGRTVKANKLDKQALYNDYVSTANVDLAFQPYGQIDKKKYAVSDADIKKVYEAEKYNFKVEEPTKDISFLAVAVNPSKEDLDAAKALAAKTASELQTKGAISKELKKEGLAAVKHTMRASDVSGNLRSFLASAAIDTVKVVSETASGFQIVKMGRRYTDVDSVQIRIVQVAGSKLPEQVLARLNAGLPADSVGKAFSADSVFAAPAQWIQLYNREGRVTTGIDQSKLDSLMNNTGRYMILDQQAEGAVIASAVSKTNPVEVYEYEQVDYNIQPSAKTINDARTKLEKYLASNNTPAKFKANAEKAGYNVMDVQVSQSSPAISNGFGLLPDSRQVVRWVMIDSEKGDVSHIYESKDAQRPMLYAAAVIDEYDDYVPVTNAQLKEYLEEKARRAKVGDERVAQYGKLGNLNAVAGKMGVTPRQVADFRFSSGTGAGDPKVVGRIMGAKANPKMVVVKGDDGVYAFVVKGNGKEKFDYNDQSLEQQFMQSVLGRDAQGFLTNLLKGDRKLQNNTYRFEAGD